MLRKTKVQNRAVLQLVAHRTRPSHLVMVLRKTVVVTLAVSAAPVDLHKLKTEADLVTNPPPVESTKRK